MFRARIGHRRYPIHRILSQPDAQALTQLPPALGPPGTGIEQVTARRLQGLQVTGHQTQPHHRTRQHHGLQPAAQQLEERSPVMFRGQQSQA